MRGQAPSRQRASAGGASSSRKTYRRYSPTSPAARCPGRRPRHLRRPPSAGVGAGEHHPVSARGSSSAFAFALAEPCGRPGAHGPHSRVTKQAGQPSPSGGRTTPAMGAAATSAYRPLQRVRAAPSVQSNDRQRLPSALLYLLKNGTHVTNRGSQGAASRGLSPFLGVMCWPLLGGVDNARWDEGVRRLADRGPAVPGGRARTSRRLLPHRGHRDRPPLRGTTRAGSARSRSPGKATPIVTRPRSRRTRCAARTSSPRRSPSLNTPAGGRRRARTGRPRHGGRKRMIRLHVEETRLGGRKLADVRPSEVQAWATDRSRVLAPTVT